MINGFKSNPGLIFKGQEFIYNENYMYTAALTYIDVLIRWIWIYFYFKYVMKLDDLIFDFSDFTLHID